jgi:hypothetical protein
LGDLTVELGNPKQAKDFIEAMSVGKYDNEEVAAMSARYLVDDTSNWDFVRLLMESLPEGSAARKGVEKVLNGRGQG